ncbi:MAG: hypothetical protein IJC97_03830 [Oscillospiraceae bacterium]|nr:hypothetical protein [Oscillospiraceae bacterium]
MRLKTIIRNIFWGIVLATTLGTQVNFAAEDGTNIMDESVTELKNGRDITLQMQMAY